MNGSLTLAAEAMQGVLHGSDRTFDGVSTDSRTIREGELFVALSGPNFDGNKFVGQARGKGAAAAVVNALTDEVLLRSRLRIRASHLGSSLATGSTSIPRLSLGLPEAMARRRSRK